MKKRVQSRLCSHKITFTEGVHGRLVVALFSGLGHEFDTVNRDLQRLETAQTFVHTVHHVFLAQLHFRHIAGQLLLSATTLRQLGLEAFDLTLKIKQ